MITAADTTTRTIQVSLSIVLSLAPEDPENPSLAAQQGWTLLDYSEEELRDALTPDAQTLNALLERAGLDLHVQDVHAFRIAGIFRRSAINCKSPSSS
jgi:hypothetical protein